MPHATYDSEYLRSIFLETRVIALVGGSANKARPSYGVMEFLLTRSFDVVPINPGLAGQNLQGQKVYAALADVPMGIDMVDVFRASDAVSGLVDEIISLARLPKTMWTQLGVSNLAAAAKAEAAGLRVVMNRCPVIEMHRLNM